MANNICSPSRCAFTALVGVLWMTVFSLLTDAAPAPDNEYGFISVFEDVIIPKQVDTLLMDGKTYDTPDPAAIGAKLPTAIAGAKAAFANAIFKKQEFLDLRKTFKGQLEAFFTQYGKQGSHMILCRGPVLAPSKLAAIAQLCEVNLGDIKAAKGGITVPCASASNKAGAIVVMSIHTGFDDDATRNGFLSLTTVPTPTDFATSPLSKVPTADWVKMYNGSNTFKTHWQRIIHSVFFQGPQSKTTKRMSIFSVGSEVDDLINLTDDGSYVGYANKKVLKKGEAKDVTVDIPVLPIAEKKGDDYVTVKDKNVVIRAFSVHLKLSTSKMSDEESLKDLSKVLAKSTDLLFSTDSPNEREVASNDVKNVSVRAVSVGVFHLWAVCLAVLVSTAAHGFF